ncbi:gephyrin-like molybdotransferase Glp [uncultured Chitinophaga sp.]|uniref:molybdopterin molybdotransferase MoeA n=1 Tax=uncultured Chitinophaga sp. TaxID=339340 RepID=UPI0025ED9007|nr:gephyrin-like molybdotransferase Glp [uncultured Chitinophaga sp.]
MISVSIASQILNESTGPGLPALLPLNAVSGLVLAEDILAPRNIPAFRQAAMDGYAFNYESWKSNGQLEVSGEIPAGAGNVTDLKRQQAMRIFTGAPVPDGADTVVMQEKTTVEAALLQITDDVLKQGGNVRPIGSEAMAGSLALRKGTKLTPAAIGFLATMGIAAVKVYPKPRVHIIITGNELQSPGQPLAAGQVYEANSASLMAALHQLHITDVNVQHVEDNLEALQLAISKALANADIVLTTGGVSVGDYDFVAEALSSCGVTTLFHRVKQKPAKPMYAGKLGNTLIFGLPGNPSAVLTCFYVYVQPVLQRLMGQPASEVKTLPITHDFVKPSGLTHFLKGICSDTQVTLLTGQESYKLNTFAIANCLVKLAPEGQVYRVGDEVEIIMIG